MHAPPTLQKPIRENASLAPYTTWKIGGPARYLAEPSAEEAPLVLRWAAESNLTTYILGRGSNVLIADQGLPGVVILTRDSMTDLRHADGCIIAGAGVSLPRLSKFAANLGYTGYEFLIGIPGTVGGGLAMNAGLTVYRPKEMVSITKDFVITDPSGAQQILTMADIHATYRHTDLLEGTRLVTQVRFKLEEPGDPKLIHHQTIEHLRERKHKQPLDKPTAGSSFKSPPFGRSAGWYIEQSGLKGFGFGDAEISTKHANWIINKGTANAEDVRRLIAHIQETVSSRFSVNLETEIQYFE